MDSGELDFYQHTKVCSNTCRSTKIDLTGARVSLTSQTSTEYFPLTPASADGMFSACYSHITNAITVVSVKLFTKKSYWYFPSVCFSPSNTGSLIRASHWSAAWQRSRCLARVSLGYSARMALTPEWSVFHPAFPST